MILCTFVLLYLFAPPVVPVRAAETTSPVNPASLCIVPPNPQNGSFHFTGTPNEHSIQLTTTCDPGYLATYNRTVYCSYGRWTQKIPECLPSCKYVGHWTVSYTCYVGPEIRNCYNEEASGTVVNMECAYTGDLLPPSTCVDGFWDSYPTCIDDCGRLSSQPNQVQNEVDGLFPWHVHIYRKSKCRGCVHTRVCSGSVYTRNLVISAAHCFFDERTQTQHLASSFMVAVGKQHPAWDEPRDLDVQTFDVRQITINEFFQGNATGFSNDMAILRLSSDIAYNDRVGPVCVDFDNEIQARHLRKGKIGKVATWSVPVADRARVLQLADTEHVDTEQCKQAGPTEFTRYLTADKYCLRYHNSSALCKADSGSGVVFPESDRGSPRYYLRGVVSTAPSSNESECNAFPFVTYTGVIVNQEFIEKVFYSK